MNSLAASCSTRLMHHFDWIAHIVKQSINHACHKAAACMPTDQCALSSYGLSMVHSIVLLDAM